MGVKDLIVTPFFLIVIYFLAYRFRHLVSDSEQRVYFIPALTVKIAGAIMLGLIYQFYYGGGDTFNFVQLGTRHMYDAFFNAPSKFFGLLLSDGRNAPELYPYSSQIYHFSDPSSFLVIKLASIAGIFSLHTYSVMAISFALFSFSGSWVMYIAFCRIYPNLKKRSAYVIFFIPSVALWGSGLLKDSITFGAVGWLFYCFTNIFLLNRKLLSSIVIALIAFYLIKVIKIYILLCLLPALIIWIFLHFGYRLKSAILRASLKPFLLVMAIALAYLAANIVSSDNNRYNLDQIASTAKITYDYLTYMSKQQGGAYYSLGPIDNSISGLLSKAHLAINVALFRPYVWEVKNPIMAFSAIESGIVFILTVYILLKRGLFRSFRIINKNPFLLFSLVFSLSFAFAIGISTANFGTLVRYKIPLLPFYLLFLLVMFNAKKDSEGSDSGYCEVDCPEHKVEEV